MSFVSWGLASALAVFSTWGALRSKNRRRYWQICALLLWSGLICLLIGEKGTTLDKDLIVQEVGFILPLGAIMLGIGTIGLIILSVLSLYQQQK